MARIPLSGETDRPELTELIARHFDAQQILEVTVLAGAYNMHTRVTRALQLDVEQAAQKDGK